MKHARRHLPGFKIPGFTIIELMVVIFIITALVAILLPVLGKVKLRAAAADTQAFVAQLSTAIDAYQQEYRAYPGPLPDYYMYNQKLTTAAVASFNPIPTGYSTATLDPTKITASENLVLGLCGGLRYVTPGTPTFYQYDPSQVGMGPMSMNAANPVRGKAFIDPVNLSWRLDSNALKFGHFSDGGGIADDSIIPEFVDRFSSPMPIIYGRAKRGVPPDTATSPPTAIKNSVVTYDPADALDVNGNPIRNGTYDVHQFLSYTGAFTGGDMALVPDAPTGVPSADSRSIGESRRAPQYVFKGSGNMSGSNYNGLRTVDVASVLKPADSPNYSNPIDAFAYLQNPASPNTARNKDSYILISAGIDRIYGTADDLTNFGSVGE